MNALLFDYYLIARKGINMTKPNSGVSITKAIVKAANPKTKDFFLWDSMLKGFGLKVTPSGRKTFVIQYRIGSVGATKRLSLGPVSEFTVGEARLLAAKKLQQARDGEDPAASRKAAKAALTVAEVLEDFFSSHVDTRLKDRSQKEYRSLRRLHIEPALGKMKVCNVDRATVSRFHTGLKEKAVTANRCLAVLSKFFNWCEELDIIPLGSNPCRHVKKFKEKPCERFLNSVELNRLMNTFDLSHDELPVHGPSLLALKLLLLIGARKDEIRTLKWSYVDLEEGVLNLPDSKTGKKSICLNEAAIALLKRIMPVGDNPFVFVGGKPGTCVNDLERPWQKVRKVANLEDVRIHDLRHTWASLAINNGERLEDVSKALGHSQLQTTQRYAHLQYSTVQEVANRVGALIEGTLGAN
ncbi:tyrosine-type recombinase/integrase [Pseudahrensia aquimaris]|uniref:Tyrosine-type recombinase/integrase n=1 Tax=Pseudahrensia aquimaris TaxID=744461 RepID=A0ABW3FDY9_9HYPH